MATVQSKAVSSEPQKIGTALVVESSRHPTNIQERQLGTHGSGQLSNTEADNRYTNRFDDITYYSS
jgi:hypothetical protein